MTGTQRGTVFFLLLALFFPRTSAVAADAPKPLIKSASTHVALAGHTTSVVVYGDNLAPKGVDIAKPLSAKLIDVKPTAGDAKAKGSTQVTIEVIAPANCPRTVPDLVLIQPDGVKVGVPIVVGPDVAAVLQVKKPLANFTNAMLLPGPAAIVSGALDGDDPHVFHFDAKAGETWDISLSAGRIGSSADPILRVRDARHYTLMLSAGDKKRDRHIVFKAPTDGPYYIEVIDAESKGGGDYNYLLSLVRISP